MATTVADAKLRRLEEAWHEPEGLRTFLLSVDHKRIGKRYLVTAFLFFVLAGLEALALRTQLAQPNQHVLGPEAYDELFTMHGVTMIFLFVTPMLSGFGNYLVPLMIGARDMAFPRMNALSYWIYLGSGLFMTSSLLAGRAPNDGWFNYVPLSDAQHTPGPNIDFYDLGLLFLTVSSTVGAVNFIATILKLRAPGMSINRMPLFCWAMLATSFSLVFALPALSAANIMLELQRRFGFHFFDRAHGGDALLWQHLFWIFGHPDVYIIFLPAVGIVSSIVPVFARREIVGYTWLALATMVTALVGFGVWVHHMFATGLPQIDMVFFSAASLLITIPSGIQIFAWTATILKGRPLLASPMLYILGFVVVFVIGGLTGVMFAAIPFDQQVTDSYFVVAHFHYVLFGGAVFPIFGAIHYWYPKLTGRMLDERLARVAFWIFFVGFNLTFFPMHVAGLLGMPRRVYTYPGGLGWDVLNLVETIGAFTLAVGILLVALNVVRSRSRGALAGPDPWGANTLEWATSSPPPHYNFPVIPRVSSADANWDLADREEDRRTLEAGEWILPGHETPATTAMDAELDAVHEMPEESPWPLALAASLLVFFFLGLMDHWVAAGLSLVLVAGSLAGWHWTEPEEELPMTAAVSVARGTVRTRPLGWWGMWLLIATETALFGVFVAAYFYLRFRTQPWPPDGLPKPEPWWPVASTAVLVCSSLPVQVAAHAVRRRERGRALLALGTATVLALLYLGGMVQVFAETAAHYGPRRDAYASMQYLLNGAHWAHVAAGVLVNLFLLLRLGLAQTRYRAVGVEVLALYWHFVNVLALVVLATTLSPLL